MFTTYLADLLDFLMPWREDIVNRTGLRIGERMLSLFPDMPEHTILIVIEEITPSLAIVGNIIDVPTLAFVWGSIASYELFMISYRIVYYIYKLIPTT